LNTIIVCKWSYYARIRSIEPYLATLDHHGEMFFQRDILVTFSRPRRSKLDDKSKTCVFLEVSDKSKTYKLYGPHSKKLIINKNVVF